MVKRKHFSIESGVSASARDKSGALNPSKTKPLERLSDEWWARSKHPERRCTAHRSDGTRGRCKNPALRFQTVCRYHGGAAKRSKEAAQRRLGEALDRMARELLGMAMDDDVSDSVKLAAIKEALALGGISAKTAVEVEHTLKPYERIISNISGVRTGSSRAESRARRGLPPADRAEPPILDAEVIDDEPLRPSVRPAAERTRRKHTSPRPNPENSLAGPYGEQKAPITGMAAIEAAAAANRAAGIHGKKRKRR